VSATAALDLTLVKQGHKEFKGPHILKSTVTEDPQKSITKHCKVKKERRALAPYFYQTGPSQ